VCMQSILLDPQFPNFPYIPSISQYVSGLQLAKCTYIGKRADTRRKSPLVLSLKLSKKFQLARSLALPGRDENDRDALGGAGNRPKWVRFGGFLPDFGPAWRGRRPTSGPTGSGRWSSTARRRSWEGDARRAAGASLVIPRAGHSRTSVLGDSLIRFRGDAARTRTGVVANPSISRPVER
jgi:hypothetical protein